MTIAETVSSRPRATEKADALTRVHHVVERELRPLAARIDEEGLYPSDVLKKLGAAGAFAQHHEGFGESAGIDLGLAIEAMSIVSEAGFLALATITGFLPVKLIFLVLVWAYLHHFCAGIRYLTLDLHMGLDKVSAQKSAGVVFGVSLALTLVFALKLFGAW